MSNARVHESAVVDAGARIGNGTSVWHFSHVMAAVIGDNCTLGQNVFIGNDVVVGNGVKIQNNVSVYTGVEIEDYVFLGPSMVFTNVINPRSAIARKAEFKRTVVRKGVTIGANATIICGIELGEYAFIGAGAVVTNPVLPFQLILGNPGKPAGWMSMAGHKLQFDQEGRAVCAGDGSIYKLNNGQVTKIS